MGAERRARRTLPAGELRCTNKRISLDFFRQLAQFLYNSCRGPISPTVISTTDAIKGAIPLTHTRCSIIKVHGDYLDTRIKNTPSELAQYNRELDLLLDRIFDEFGLTVCGWSAEWDAALRAALERCDNHRFATFWTVRDDPSTIASRLIQLRRAEVRFIFNLSRPA